MGRGMAYFNKGNSESWQVEQGGLCLPGLTAGFVVECRCFDFTTDNRTRARVTINKKYSYERHPFVFFLLFFQFCRLCTLCSMPAIYQTVKLVNGAICPVYKKPQMESRFIERSCSVLFCCVNAEVKQVSVRERPPKWSTRYSINLLRKEFQNPERLRVVILYNFGRGGRCRVYCF